jgi:hypothetical protein
MAMGAKTAPASGDAPRGSTLGRLAAARGHAARPAAELPHPRQRRQVWAAMRSGGRRWRDPGPVHPVHARRVHATCERFPGSVRCECAGHLLVSASTTCRACCASTRPPSTGSGRTRGLRTRHPNRTATRCATARGRYAARQSSAAGTTRLDLPREPGGWIAHHDRDVSPVMRGAAGEARTRAGRRTNSSGTHAGWGMEAAA